MEVEAEVGKLEQQIAELDRSLGSPDLYALAPTRNDPRPSPSSGKPPRAVWTKSSPVGRNWKTCGVVLFMHNGPQDDGLRHRSPPRRHTASP